MENYITNIPFKLASRENHPENTIIRVGDVTIGEGLTLIAGPCAVESETALFELAQKVKASGRAFFEEAHLSLEPHHMIFRVLAKRA